MTEMQNNRFLKPGKGKRSFKWEGSKENLEKFLSDLGHTGEWSGPSNANGHPYQFKSEISEFTCTWYSTTKTLQIQGKKVSETIHQLKQVLDDATEAETRLKASGHGVNEGNQFNEDEIRDGVNPGEVIANLLRFRMKKWNKEGAKVTIATPFMDKVGLDFIVSCLENETAPHKVYTRKNCAWDKTIDQVIAEAELSKHWIANKVVALEKKRSFHAKFLAGEYKDNVELIVTSCNMTSEHLNSEQLETVMRIECGVETFRSDWLKPLELKTNFPNMDDIRQELQKIE